MLESSSRSALQRLCYLVDLNSSDNPNDVNQVCERGLRGQTYGSVQAFTHKVGVVWDGAGEAHTADGAESSPASFHIQKSGNRVSDSLTTASC